MSWKQAFAPKIKYFNNLNLLAYIREAKNSKVFYLGKMDIFILPFKFNFILQLYFNNIRQEVKLVSFCPFQNSSITC